MEVEQPVYLWTSLWAHSRRRFAPIDLDIEEFKALYRVFEPTEMEYRGG